MTSVAMVPVKRSPCCVVALSSVSVMRTGRVVSGGRVMLWKAGGGGGGGGADGSSGAGGGAVAASVAGGAGSDGGAWRTMGAGVGFGGAGAFSFGGAAGLEAGGGGGGGTTAAVTVGAAAWTVRLLTMVLIPATWAASAAARERAASLLTVPVSVAVLFWTADWMGSVLSAPSLAMRLWTAAVRLASSVGVAGAELLQPARLRARARAVAVRVAREMERGLMTYMDHLFLR